MLIKPKWKPSCSRDVCKLFLRTNSLRNVAQLRLPLDLPTIKESPIPSVHQHVFPRTPEGLGIDHKKPLAGTAPYYDQHIVIDTGTTTWPSRIESQETPNLAAMLKGLIKPGNQLHDVGSPPETRRLITNSSFAQHENGFSAYLFPDFVHVKHIQTPDDVKALLSSEKQSQLPFSRVERPVILICGHEARDRRCGIIGPLLKTEFERCFKSRQTIFSREGRNPVFEMPTVALCSHVGGHAWAGNVIIYIPTVWTTPEKTLERGGGTGIWYGRVEPKHVEGIVQSTVFDGVVIEDLFRGGIRQVEGFTK